MRNPLFLNLHWRTVHNPPSCKPVLTVGLCCDYLKQHTIWEQPQPYQLSNITWHDWSWVQSQSAKISLLCCYMAWNCGISPVSVVVFTGIKGSFLGAFGSCSSGKPAAVEQHCAVYLLIPDTGWFSAQLLARALFCCHGILNLHMSVGNQVVWSLTCTCL